jgi:hypothetical protein
MSRSSLPQRRLLEGGRCSIVDPTVPPFQRSIINRQPGIASCAI